MTSFEFQLHPVGPEVYAGLVVYPFAQARQVLRAWRDFTAGAPDELSVWTVLRKAPPLPFLPASVHGTEVVIFPLVYSGDVDAGKRAAAPVLQFGDPIGSRARADALCRRSRPPSIRCSTPGGRNYWKSNNFSTLSDAALDVMIDAAGRLPGPECEIFVAQLGGAMARVNPAATAFVGRDAHYIMNVHGRWSDARDDERVRAWARQVFQDAAPHATGSGYVNFLTEDEAERVAASYGANYARLQAVKQRFDPGNLFRMNLNIAPAARATAQRVAMSGVDARGCRITGATPAALRGATNARSPRSRAGAAAPTRSSALALQEAPDFVMAHVLQAWLLAVQPRSATRALGAPGAGARRRPAGQRARARCTSRRSPPCSPTTTNAPRRGSASCCACSRATRSRCRWRMRSTTSPATPRACATASRRCCRRGRATCPATTPCWRCTPSASRSAASTSAPSRPPTPRWR